MMSENTTGIGTQEKAIIRQLEELSENGVIKLMNQHRLDTILTPNSDATPSLPTLAFLALWCRQGMMSRVLRSAFAIAGSRVTSRG
jgi:amidase